MGLFIIGVAVNRTWCLGFRRSEAVGFVGYRAIGQVRHHRRRVFDLCLTDVGFGFVQFVTRLVFYVALC